MTPPPSWLLLPIALLCGCAGGAGTVSALPAGQPARSRIALARPLPPLDGRNLKATIVELTYDPGGVSSAHSHPCPVMVYVIEGAVRTRVRGEREAVVRAGETFYEAPGGVHELSANASDEAPARFLAIFLCDRDTPVTQAPPAVTRSQP